MLLSENCFLQYFRIKHTKQYYITTCYYSKTSNMINFDIIC